MRLGLGSYTFTWAIGVPGLPPPRPLGALGLLSEARRLGVRVLQVCDNLPLHRLEPEALDTFEAAAREAGIAIEIGTRGIAETHLRQYLALARRFGSPILRVVVDQPGDEPAPAEIVARLRPLLPDFARAGVKLALENHDRFRARVLADLIEELGPDHAGICLDTVNSFGALEGPDLVVPTLAPYTLGLHVKDFTVRRPAHQMGFLVEGCAAGSGRLDVPRILQCLREAGRQPAVNAILETWVTPADRLEDTLERERRWTEQGLAFLRRLIPD